MVVVSFVDVANVFIEKDIIGLYPRLESLIIHFKKRGIASSFFHYVCDLLLEKIW